jgi:hypothetical protein
MNQDERDLLARYRALDIGQRRMVSEFAAFLATRETVPAPEIPAQPLNLPRPADEKVMQAIKRLRATYPMLDQTALLNEVSQHVTEHLVKGRPANEVIDDLEALFKRHYDASCD